MSSGTTPAGLRDEQQIARWVRRMFDGVAPRYDLLNHLLSLNMDKLWRARTVRRLRPLLNQPGLRAIDLCCGTGDLLIALAAANGGVVFGSDFCHPMLTAARAKTQSLRAQVFEADALQLPVPPRSFDLVTIAFGFRNLANYGKGLQEVRRILKPGGTAAILEFSTPPNSAFRAFYQFYSRNVLPRIGAAVSGAPEAYRYLPDSVRKFPGAEDLAAQMRHEGFRNVGFERMTFGVVALHTGIA